MLRHRKANVMTFNMMAFIPRIVFLTFAFFACFFLLRMFVNQNFETQGIQAEILVQGLLYGPGGVSYVDPMTGRIYPEIIDPRQWDVTDLDSAFNFPNNNLITARISLTKDKSTEIRGLARAKKFPSSLDGYTVLKQVYYNKQWWDNWEPLAKSRLGGLGGIDTDTTEVPVLYYDEDRVLRSGFLQIVILQPN